MVSKLKIDQRKVKRTYNVLRSPPHRKEKEIRQRQTQAVLVPAFKKGEGIKGTIIRDRLLFNGKSYSFDKINKKGQEVSTDEEMLERATHDEEPEEPPAMHVKN